MLVDGGIDLSFQAYDGSSAGHPSSDMGLRLESPHGAALIASAPGQIGLVRAFVAGELTVEGDLFAVLSRLRAHHRDDLSLVDKARLVQSFGTQMLRRVPAPPEEVVLDGRRHTRRRDHSAISHHYDVSNDFYRLILGPSMAYTCAVYPQWESSLEEAQAEKHDLVCRKLGLRPGMRLLDLGCGWGGMAIHAAENYGVEVLGVTLSQEQSEWGQKAVVDRGLADRVQLRFQDYRDVKEDGFDAVSSIGLTEHLGRENYGSYFSFVRSKLVLGGRLLNHCITRADPHEATRTDNGFINRYIFPDGELVPVSDVMSAMEESGLEVRHSENFREHYARTLRDWSANLEAHETEAILEAGERKTRVWKLYLAAARLGFVENVIQLHQVLATRSDDGDSRMPLRVPQ